mmetsp:Transcript_3573/g.4142  ORF Transcript_3573/g.4142 Transcript_3573/m.4142 type:complete len:228 (-) Transcript_3573:129-812(-)|eukprot:CAMPEP_0204618138 /NCGR_PEP_ID=MMETSP0717-20131115/4876_1 /ASSEMBLY_ACC=CAM_ASM_000666 /TAXON_ID=230516 /ORGANISM="Chaetoceros curvisetus" /LENGTH=227 /DNA_ID=CAMNT_0051631811 /DNA_START=49 /DNA_END=732 /DNA_ORIENTATION=+
MAPNLPESASLLSLQSLDLSQHFGFNSKYQPLSSSTIGKEEAAAAVSCNAIVSNLLAEADLQDCDFFPDAPTVRRADQECKSAEEVESYWYMPSEKPEYFSASHLESMAVKDAHRRSSSQTQGPQSQDLDEAVASYWDWSVRERAEAEKSLEHKERVLRLLSSGNIAEQEVRSHASQVQTKKNIIYSNQQASDDYFFQPSQDENKAAQNYKTLEEDEAREAEQYWDW